MTKKETKEKTVKNSTKKPTTTAKKTANKKTTASKKVENNSTKKAADTVKKLTAKKVAKTSKTTKEKAIKEKTSKTTKKSSATKNINKKVPSTSNKTTKSKTTKTVTSKKGSKTTKSTTNKISVMEYYDLPYKYNQTVVKILAQTPSILFVYWEISDIDRNEFIKYYGEDFFSKTKPVLIIHNETMNYSFEIEINDFANSWYLHINDANCKYEIELGRRPLSYNSNIKETYIYVSSSNKLDAPNDHVLFESFDPNVTYKNIKTGNIVKRDFNKSLPYSLYRKLYNDKKLFKDLLDGKFTNSSSSPSF